MTTSASPQTLIDAQQSIDLIDGEEILHVVGRHWILLAVELLIPILVILLTGALALYRAAGGQFLVDTNSRIEDLALLDQILIGVLFVLGAIFMVSWTRNRKQRTFRFWLLGFGALFGVVFYLRRTGVALFAFDSFSARPFDLVNIVLYVIIAIAVISCGYIYYNWANDELILTNFRVVSDNDTVLIPKLLEARVQDQIAVSDIQNVLAKTTNYLEQWLNYGRIVIQSATSGRNIVFNAGQDPVLMQNKIMARVRQVQSQSTDQNYADLIEKAVYNARVDKPRIRMQSRVVKAPSFLNWLLEENPQINESNQTIIWRKHWLFLLRSILMPVGAFAVAMILWSFAVQARLLGAGLLTVILLLLIVGFIAWGWWEIEDYRNDLYILSPTGVVDREKKPLGPEERRTASLGAIQNVSYETSFISNLLGYGNVVLTTAGSGGAFTFTHVPDPREVVAVISDYLAEFKRAEKERSLNDMLALLRHYHQAQQRHNEI